MSYESAKANDTANLSHPTENHTEASDHVAPTEAYNPPKPLTAADKAFDQNLDRANLEALNDDTKIQWPIPKTVNEHQYEDSQANILLNAFNTIND